MKEILKTVLIYSLVVIAIPLFMLNPLCDIFSISHPFCSDIYFFLSNSGLFFYFLSLFFRQLACDWKQLHKISWIIKSLAGYFLVLLLSVGLSLIFVKNTPQPSQNQLNLEAVQTPFIRQLMPFMLIGITPVMEELFFRGLLIGRLKHKISPWILCLFSILIFSFLHLRKLEEIKVIFPYLSVAAVCTFFYVKNKYNLWYPIFIHMLNNFFAEIVFRFL